MNRAAEPSRVRVAFEISTIGRGHFNPAQRTGLYRVTLELLSGLRAVPEIELLPFAHVLRGETAAELRLLDIDIPVLFRSKLERRLFPWARRLVPPDQPRNRALSTTRRKRLRTATEILEALGPWTRQLEASADIVHFTYDPVSEVGLRPNRGPPKVITVHDVLPLTHPQFFRAGNAVKLHRVVDDIRQGAWAHCVSHATRAALIERVPDAASRSFVAGLAAHPDIFHVPSDDRVKKTRARFAIHDAPYLLTVGTQDPRKNHLRVFLTYAALLERHPELKLVVTGAAASDETPWETWKDRFPQAQPIFTGFVTNDELAPLYHGAAAFLFPSFAEGFGLPALEAMQCATPVVASNTTSLPEVVGDGGVLLDPADGDAWVAHVDRILTEPGWARALRQQGLRRAQERTWTQTIGRLTEGYQRMFGSVRSRTPPEA